jgi:hypothetical protein
VLLSRLGHGHCCAHLRGNYQLAEHFEAEGARLESGLPHVDFVREIPEAMKPRAIPIASSRLLPEPLTRFQLGASRERALSFRADETSTVSGKAQAPLAPSTMGLRSISADTQASHELSLQCSIFLKSSIEVQRIYGCCFVPTYGTVLRAGQIDHGGYAPVHGKR